MGLSAIDVFMEGCGNQGAMLFMRALSEPDILEWKKAWKAETRISAEEQEETGKWNRERNIVTYVGGNCIW